MLKMWIFLLAILLPVASSAMEWPSGSWIWNSSEILNVGKSHISITHQTRSADKRLNRNGRSEIIGRSSRQISERNGRSVVREFKVEMDYERWSPTWAYGISPGWTLMAMLPMTRLRSNITEDLREEGGASLSANSAGPALKAFKKSSGVQIADAGEYNNMRVGRFELRSKHRIIEKGAWAVTMFETLKFPTLEKTQVDFVAFTDPLPRSFGSALGMLFNASLTRDLDLVLSSEYLYQFEDDVYARKIDGMPTEETVSRQPGAEILSKVGTEYEFKEHITASAGYSYQGKAEDSYEEIGLQETEDSEKHSVYVGLAYLSGLRNSKRLGQKGFSAAIGYEALLSGVNVENSDTLNLELQMTF